MGNETAMHDAYESGLLLSFLEASDSGAIAPSLLSQLTGSDRFPAGFSEFKRDRDAAAAPPPPALSRDLNSLEEPRDLDGGDLDGYSGAFEAAMKTGMVLLRLYTGTVASASATDVKAWDESRRPKRR